MKVLVYFFILLTTIEYCKSIFKLLKFMYNFIQKLFKIGVAGLSFKRESFKFPNASLLHFVHCRL